MFPSVDTLSPALELSNKAFNGYSEFAMDNLDNMEKSSDVNLNMMVNQLYMNQFYLNSSFEQQQLQPPHTTNYQYSVGHQFSPEQQQQQQQQQQLQEQEHQLQLTMDNVFNDATFLSPSLDEIPATTTSTSTLSDLDSLQFIHPQDVVNFPSIHACTPPMEQLNSRRASLLESNNNIPLRSLIDLELSQQHTQADSFVQPHSTDLISSVETTPILSDLSQLQSFDQVATQELATSLQEAIEKEFNEEEDTKFHYKDIQNNNIKKSESGAETDEEILNYEIPEITEVKNFRVVRGVSSGGCATRPPKEAKDSNSNFVKVKLHLSSAGIEDMCLPAWNELEKVDRRRIIRIERRQHYADIVASFSIVGSAIDHPEPVEAEDGVSVVEVSCLETVVDDFSDDYDNDGFDLNSDETLSEDELQEQMNQRFHAYKGKGSRIQYYITSVEVIKIFELLIGPQLADGANRRRERGRVRSNLVPFWSRKPVSSKKGQSANSSPIESKDFRVELAQRIMGYEVRKPRGFDKEVRILKWEKLIPALRRALQSYYVEIP